MANSVSAKKRVRQTVKRTEIKKSRRSRIKTFIRKLEEAIESKDSKAAKECLRVAQPEMMRGVTKGLFHKNTVSRTISRLSARVKAI
jgi:small subunit ribosomal protein S20